MTEISSARVIWKVLEDAAHELPHRRMYVYQGQEISFQEVDKRSDRVAAGLLKLGFTKGDRVGVIGLNQPEWLYTYFGAAKIGAVIVGLNVRYRQCLVFFRNMVKMHRVVFCPDDMVRGDGAAAADVLCLPGKGDV